MLCKYCNNEATYPPKTKWGGWCCCDRFYDCPGYKSRHKQNCNTWSRGLTQDDDPKLARPAAKGKRFGISLTGHTEDTRKKISNSMNGNRNANHRGDRQSTYNGIRMDSRWEIGVARYLDRNNLQWKYSEKGFKLSNGRYYYPDFFLYSNENLIKIIEVKGYFRQDNKEKFEIFLKEYPDVVIELWQRDKLKELGIINSSGYLIEE